jgi:hypothetical protein
MCSAKKVDVIPVHAYHLDLVSLLYTRSRVSDYPNDLFIEKGFPVFNREDDVIMNQPCTLVPFLNRAFIVHLVTITRLPVASCREFSSSSKSNFTAIVG